MTNGISSTIITIIVLQVAICIKLYLLSDHNFLSSTCNHVEHWVHSDPVASSDAIRKQIHLHDRILVQSMAHIRSFGTSNITSFNFSSIKPSTLCINIFTSNRRIPYIDAALSLLLQSSSNISDLLSYASINVLNIERRPDKISFPHLSSLKQHLPFVSFINITDRLFVNQNNNYTNEMSFVDALKLQTIEALDICLKSELPYCLLMEDDAVVGKDFVSKLEKFVIQQDVNASSISLFSYHNTNWGHTNALSRRLDDREYIDSEAYQFDLQQASDIKKIYKLEKCPISYGAVANLYSREMLVELELFLNTTARTDSRLRNERVDVLMNKRSMFPKAVKRKRYHVTPSLVNHIGFYSEHRDVFEPLVTDVRWS